MEKTKEFLEKHWKVILGVVLFIVAAIMQSLRVNPLPFGSKVIMTIGGGSGFALGAGIGGLIGGIGIVSCGSGWGIPVGVVCLGLGALLGGCGGIIGWLLGKISNPMFPPEAYMPIYTLAIVFIVCYFYDYWKVWNKSKQ